MSRATKAPVLRRSRTDDLCAVRQLLSAAGLPIDDVGPRLLQHFLIAELDDEIIGLVGLQVYDSKGLLRSLVVALNYRNAGLGERLIRALESAAQAVGISELWLLTIDAERFFARHGFNIVSRETVPEAIRKSAEFTELCAHSAHLMMKDLSAI